MFLAAMLLAEAGCVFMGFILYISGVQGQVTSFCAFSGSSVNLPCSAQSPTSNNKWYTVHWDVSTFVQKELSADENRVMHNTSEENNPTLTIKDLRDSDAKFYCCSNNTDQPELCWFNRIQVHLADLQVKVIPTTEGQTVTLMCSTSCPLTEKPAAYIWYKNKEFLYQDWSPWYQQLVSSDEAVTYSCAVKGYEDLRAPEVSVDSVTSTCFNVTYAKGRMCSYKQTSVDEPCSITYPREVHLQKTHAERYIILTCRTSCPQIDSQTTYRWYRGGYVYIHNEDQDFLVSLSSDKEFSCAVKDHEDQPSAIVCVHDKSCWSVDYISRRICALEGSSVNISSQYLHPDKQKPKSKFWYKIKRSSEEEAEELTESAGQVEYYDDMRNLHILRIKNLKKNDSAEYRFRLQQYDKEQKEADFPGVTVTVTGLTVKFTPSAEVTEGQRVTLTCSTSCPLTDNTNYIWYKNSRPLTLLQNQYKHLVLDPVNSQHAGSYSCAVKTHNISSREKILTVVSTTGTWTPAAATGARAALLVIIPLTVFLWIRRKRTSNQPPHTETSDNLEQVPDPIYENLSTQSKDKDQDHHYCRLHFSQNPTDAVYSTIKPVPSNSTKVQCHGTL